MTNKWKFRKFYQEKHFITSLMEAFIEKFVYITESNQKVKYA